MAAITAAVLNCIIYRYLQEPEFSAYSINNSPIDGTLVPPAALITRAVRASVQGDGSKSENGGYEDFFMDLSQRMSANCSKL
ncbi:hypothetical protein OROMI_028075 [Orobanche minor]